MLLSPFTTANAGAYNGTKPFITYSPAGQLGNQLFQIAPAIAVAKKHDATVVIPNSSYETYKEILWRLPHGSPKNIEYIYKTPEEFQGNYKKLPEFIYHPNMKFYGTFPSYKYFHEHEKKIQNVFSPSPKIQKYIQEKYGKYLNRTQSVVGLHIRTFWPDVKGLYQRKNTKEIQSFYSLFPVPDVDYIQNALQKFPKDSLFIVCSDNIKWAKKALKSLGRNFLFIQHEKYFIDFYILASCDHMIMSNSTFSWWAAYLIQNKNKQIIAPVPFLFGRTRHPDDTFPPCWIQIPRTQKVKFPDFLGNNVYL